MVPGRAAAGREIGPSEGSGTDEGGVNRMLVGVKVTGVKVTVHSIAAPSYVMGQAGDDEASEAGHHFPTAVAGSRQ